MAEAYIPPPSARQILSAMAEHVAAVEHAKVTLTIYRHDANHSTEIFDRRAKRAADGERHETKA